MKKKNPAPKVNPKVHRAAEDEDNAPPKRTSYLAGPEKARPTKNELLGVPYDPPKVIERYLLRDVSGISGPGGWGKTTLLIYEAVHVITGRPLYGRQILQTGGVVMITKEDSREITFGRLNEICRALKLTKKEQQKVLANFYVEDVSENARAKIVEADRYGARPTGFVEEIIETYKGLNIAMVLLDPTSLLGPGETSGNDGMAELNSTGRKISRALGAAVRLVHHVSQAVYRGGIVDQYAARGGTAFTDNSRGSQQFMIITNRKIDYEDNTYEVPATVDQGDLDDGNVIAIFVHKMSYEKRDKTPILLVRGGFEYRYVPIERVDQSPMAKAQKLEENRNKLQDFVTAQFRAGTKHTKSALDDHLETIGLSRKELRIALTSLMDIKLLTEEKLPANERRTSRSKYLHPAGEPGEPPKFAKSAEVRQSSPGELTNRTVAGEPKFAAGGTSIRRRTSKVKKRPKKAGGSGAKTGEVRQSSATAPAPHNGLNGQGVPHE
jgi:AAA domain